MKRIERPRLEWKRISGKLVPRHRKTWQEDGKRRERVITLDWKGDPQELDRLYWQAETGQHDAQKPAEPKMSWRALVVAWRSDPRVQKRLSDGTKRSYRRTMERLLEKNAGKDVRKTTRAHVRAAHATLAGTPRKADHFVQVVRLLWNYGRDKLDWPLGENPAQGLDLYGSTRAFPAWPSWLVDRLSDAPQDVRTMAELMLGTGQRPGAAVAMEWADFDGEWMTVTDQKADTRREVYCPPRLRSYLATLPRTGRHVLARNLTQPLGYSALEKRFRAWRATFDGAADAYSLHGLRKLAVVQLAEAGCSDAEIQAVTGQSPEMVAFYRKDASARALSRKAQERRE